MGATVPRPDPARSNGETRGPKRNATGPMQSAFGCGGGAGMGPAKEGAPTPGAATMKTLALLAVALVAFANAACAHMVRIESEPGAEIYVNGEHVGTSPATYQESTALNK